MRKTKKLLSILLACTMVTSIFGGMSVSAEEEETKNYDVTLNVVGVENILSSTMLAHTDELEEKYGIRIEFQQFTNEQASNKIAVAMGAGGRDIDVMMIRPLDETLLYSQNGWLENLQPYIDEDAEEIDYDDFMEACKDVCSAADGSAVALPMMTESGVIYYNKTLFEQAGITELPKTWDELYEVAGKVADPDNDICGFACRGSGNPAVTQFSAVLRSFGGDFFDENGTATLNTPEAVAAFEFYGKLLRDYGPAGVLNMGWPETWALLTQGKAAMRLDANTNLGSWSDDDSLISFDELGYFDVPVGPNGDYGNYYITSWALAMSSGSEHKDAAWEFIKWATSKEMQIEAQQNGSSGARNSCWEGDYSSYPQEVQEIAANAGNNGYGSDRPFMINVASGRDIIGEIIVAAIEGKEDIQAIADKQNEKFQELLDSEK